MKSFKKLIMASSLFVTATPAAAQPQTQIPPLAVPPARLDPAALQFDPKALPAPGQVLTLLEHTAMAEVARQANRPLYVPHRRGGGINTNWISATFLIGLGRLARISDEPAFQTYPRSVAEHYNFGLLGGWSPRNMLDADNIAIGDVYLELFARSGEPGEIEPLRARLDYTLPHLEKQPAPARLAWWWCDALFMAPPVMARMSAITGDPKYLRAMDVQWWRTYDRLWSEQHGLFYRDERFLTRKSRNGKPIFWGRGNGWVVAGLARLIEAMPADHPSRARYTSVFQTMMKSLADLQRTDGLWTTSLLDAADPAGPESTSSAFFTYAMAWGINHGLLDRKAYLPRTTRAWAGLAKLVQPNGLLGYAQRAGDQPEPSRPNDHALYGTGGLLLAGTEVMNLSKPPTPLPIAQPPRDPPGPLRLPIALLPKPDASDAQAVRHWERAMAERQAMIDLAYDPAIDGRAADTPPPARP